jgi:molybdate transport system substrate-binding protein
VSRLARFLAALLGIGVWRTPAAEIENRESRIENPPAVAVAAASDLVFCLPALHAEFAKTEPRTALRLTTGSSGNFFAQIKNGAPFDVFLSADLSYPRALIAAGAADEKSLVLYGVGRLVLWTTRPELNPAVDLAALVRSPAVRRLAIANPAHAPYGRAARETLEKIGDWPDAQPKLVLGDNIAQAAQFVQTGHADAGIVALALVLGAPASRDSGRWAEIPTTLHGPLEQGAVLTTRGAANPAAARYLAFLRTPTARAVFERYGFRLPQ